MPYFDISSHGSAKVIEINQYFTKLLSTVYAPQLKICGSRIVTLGQVGSILNKIQGFKYIHCV